MKDTSIVIRMIVVRESAAIYNGPASATCLAFAVSFQQLAHRYSAGRPGISITGRTSTVPLRAMGIRAAMPIASSRLLCLDEEVAAELFPRLARMGHRSPNRLPLRTRTLVAIDVGCSGLAPRYCPLERICCASCVDSA